MKHPNFRLYFKSDRKSLKFVIFNKRLNYKKINSRGWSTKANLISSIQLHM